MFWLIDKIIDSMTCFMLDIVSGEKHAHLFKEDKEVVEKKDKDTYIWNF
jgi:hypothetical protein